MKPTLLLALLMVSLNLVAQINQDTVAKSLEGLKAGNRITYSENDTIPIVVYLEDNAKAKDVLWYLNGQVVNRQVLGTIDPNKIGEIKVEKETTELDGMFYEGIVYVNTKEDYDPNLMSLNALKAKYLNIPDSIFTVFLLDGAVVNMDYDAFLVDQNYILKIEVQFVVNSKERLDIAVVELTTRTKENLEEANTIRLRGSGPHGMNTTRQTPEINY